MVTLTEQVATLLGQATPVNVPNGVLVWFGDTVLPDGLGASPAPLGPSEWAGTYQRLLGGDLGRALPSLQRIQSKAAQPGQPVPLVIASLAFARPTPAVVTAVTEAARNGTLAALPGTIAEALEPAEATVVTALLAEQWHRRVPAYRGRALQLVVVPELLVTNTGGAITEVAVDAGEGFVEIGPGGTIAVNVAPQVSSLTLTVRCRTASGIRYAACELAITDDPVPPLPDETWQLQPPIGNTGHAFVFRSGAGNRMRRPILVAEGWPGGYSPAQLAEALGQHAMLTRLLANGHDIVIVGFDKGLDTIQSNAGVITEAIVQTRKRTDDPLVVGGMSMGGLVARYALVQMEHAGVDHGAAVYLSLDSPHGRGAYTTVVGQWLVNHFMPLSPTFAGLHYLIFSPSNLQFIGLIERDGAVGPDPLRTALLQELHDMGDYPSKLVKLAIACGQGGGSSVPVPNDPVLAWHNQGLADITLLPMPAGATATIARGSTLGVPGAAPPPLVVTSEVCWETVPGALNVMNQMVTSVIASLGCDITANFGVSSSMPTVSALDASVGPNDRIPDPGSGASPFDDYLCATTDQLHLQFTAEHIDWIVDRIERHQPEPQLPRKGFNMTDTTTNDGAFNPNAPSFIENPYPTFAWYREHRPVAQLELVPGYAKTMATWVFSDADVRRVLTETDTFLKRVAVPGAPPAPPTPVFSAMSALPPGLLSSDPPRHDVVRQAVEPSFTEAIAIAAGAATAMAAARLGALKATRRFEVVHDFALPVPSTVLAQVLGLPVNDLPILTNWVQSIATSHNITMPAAQQVYGGICAMAMRTYYDALVEINQGTQGAGMLGGVCRHIGKDLQLHDVQAVMSDMLVAGYLTTTYLISTGLRSLLSNPDQLALLRNDPSLIHGAVEEMLRFDPPAQLLDRMVAVKTSLGGVDLDVGTHLIVSIGSANHDPARFENPDVFDITRDDDTQIGFGDGIHTCIGAPLARIVAPIAIMALIDLPGLRLDGIPQWQPDPYLRGLVSLPVAYDG